MSKWETLPLGDRTVNLDRRRIPVTKKDRRNGPYPYYGASGIVDYVDEYIFDGLHLLVAEDGENLRSRKMPVAFLADGKFWVNNHAHILQATVENDIRFLAYALEESDFAGHVTGSTQPKLSQRALRQIAVTAPPLSEQVAIANLLASLDDAAKSNLRVASLSEKLLDAIANSTLMGVPRVPLRELVMLNKETTNPASYEDKLVDHFSLPAFDRGARPERIAARQIKSNKLKISTPSVLVSRLNPRTDRTWWAVPHNQVVALASTEFAALTPKGSVPLAGIWLAVRNAIFREQLQRRVTGTSGSHQRIRPDDLLSIEVHDVSQLEDATFETATSLAELAESKRSEAETLVRLRNTLIPELLSGRIRLCAEGTGA